MPKYASATPESGESARAIRPNSRELWCRLPENQQPVEGPLPAADTARVRPSQPARSVWIQATAASTDGTAVAIVAKEECRYGSAMRRSAAGERREVVKAWLAVRRVALAIAVGTAAAVAATGQTTTRGPASLAIRSLAGRDLFEFYCATCHGRDGTGHGPVAAALTRPPPDLTRLAIAHAGRFPRERVERYVTNGGDMPAPAHGTSEMPVWGPVFRALDPSDARVRIRIANVVGYVESLQEKQ